MFFFYLKKKLKLVGGNTTVVSGERALKTGGNLVDGDGGVPAVNVFIGKQSESVLPLEMSFPFEETLVQK